VPTALAGKTPASETPVKEAPAKESPAKESPASPLEVEDDEATADAEPLDDKKTVLATGGQLDVNKTALATGEHLNSNKTAARATDVIGIGKRAPAWALAMTTTVYETSTTVTRTSLITASVPTITEACGYCSTARQTQS